MLCGVRCSTAVVTVMVVTGEEFERGIDPGNEVPGQHGLDAEAAPSRSSTTRLCAPSAFITRRAGTRSLRCYRLEVLMPPLRGGVVDDQPHRLQLGEQVCQGSAIA